MKMNFTKSVKSKQPRSANRSYAEQLKNAGLSRKQINRREKQRLKNELAKSRMINDTIKASGQALMKASTPAAVTLVTTNRNFSNAISNANDLINAGTSSLQKQNNITDKEYDNTYGDDRR